MSGLNIDYQNMLLKSLQGLGPLDSIGMMDSAGSLAPTMNLSAPVQAGSYPMSFNPASDAGGGFIDSIIKGLGDINLFDKAEGGKFQQGALGPLISGASALGSAYLGMKQYGLAKDTLAHNKDVFAKNFDAQKKMTNSQLEDRQRARVASSSSGAYQSVGDYMNKYEIR